MAGGALLMFGARMADGCTSGHGLSGTAQGAASSWLFTPLMFGVGSLLARVRAAHGAAQGGLMAEMNESTRNALGMATGILFGALLQRGGLADSRTIVGQLTGDDSRVAKTMGMAVAVGALGHRWLHRRGLATDEPKPMNPVGLVGGAVLFGAGMALSGYCPGTAAAAAGSGRAKGCGRWPACWPRRRLSSPPIPD